MLRILALLSAALLCGACGQVTVGSAQNCSAIFTTEPTTAATATLDSSTTELAQSFKITTAATVTNAQLKLKASAAMTGTLQLVIQTDSSGQPSGVSLGNTGTLDAAKVLTSSAAYYTFTFSGGVSLTAATLYWLRLKAPTATGSASLLWSGNNSGAYTDGGAFTYNGTSWSALGTAFDLLFNVGC
jgi:hypothetical protein